MGAGRLRIIHRRAAVTSLVGNDRIVQDVDECAIQITVILCPCHAGGFKPVAKAASALRQVQATADEFPPISEVAGDGEASHTNDGVRTVEEVEFDLTLIAGGFVERTNAATEDDDEVL